MNVKEIAEKLEKAPELREAVEALIKAPKLAEGVKQMLKIAAADIETELADDVEDLLTEQSRGLTKGVLEEWAGNSLKKVERKTLEQKPDLKAHSKKK